MCIRDRRENFARPKDQRLPTLSIVFEASKEIRTSVVHATIITIVAFVPLFFLDGMEGRMLRPLGISFIVALFASMIVAVTLTPVLCSYLLTGDRVLRRNEKEPVVSRFLKRVYRRALEWVLAHKKAVLGSTVVLFAGALAGACIGFLWFNSHPADIFMGDTGSLSIGGIIAVFALCIRKELLLPLLCGVFLVESFSVMMQVGYFKYTKRKYGEGHRLLLMAPVHHHFQKKGQFETKIVLRFWIISLLLAAITLVTLKIR